MLDSIEWLVVVVLVGILVWVAAKAWRREFGGDREAVTSQKSILSGTVPHLMDGELAEQLRVLQSLPDAELDEGAVDYSEIERCIENVLSSRTFCVLDKRLDYTQALNNPEHVAYSWRLDVVRPNSCHTSQCIWDEDSGGYVLDEWLEVDDSFFMNAGLWIQPDDQEVRDERQKMNVELYPETALDGLSNAQIGRSGILLFSGERFLFLETVPAEVQGGSGLQSQQQFWIDQGTGLLSKYRVLYSQGQALQAERVSSYSGYGLDVKCQIPEAQNSSGEESSAQDADVVEHW